MRDFKFDSLAKITRVDISSVESINTPAIRNTAIAFISNANRVCCLAGFPVELSCVLMHVIGMLGGLLIKRLFGKQQETNFDLASAVKSFLENLPPFLEKEGSGIDALARSIWENPDYAELLRQFVNKTIPQLANDVKVIDVGVDAFLAAIIVNGWTAFETLAGDLWVQSVNAQPRYLAALAGRDSRIESIMGSQGKDKSVEEAREDEIEVDSADYDLSGTIGDKKIPLSLICKVTNSNYNLSESMGDLLVDAERVKFTSLKEIRKAYSLAFPQKVKRGRSARIDAALSDRSLDALSAVRNLIVHKAGKVDSAYEEDCKAAPTAPRLKEGETLQLDGELCQSLISPVIKASVELINAVDSWLTQTR